MACRKEPDGLCQDSWLRVALLIKIGEELPSPPSKSLLYMMPAWHLIFLGKVLQKGIVGLIRTHKVVTTDDISGRIGKL